MDSTIFSYATFSQRMIAIIIDMIIFIIGLMLLAILLQLVGLQLLPDMSGMTIQEFMTKYQNDPGSLRAYNMTITGLNILYFAHFESSDKQATPGKQLMKIIVTDQAGKSLTLWQAIIRNTGKIISQMILFIGYFICLFTKRKQTLHDILANTLVIQKDNTSDIT